MSQKLKLSSALEKKRVELCRDTNCGQILNEWLIPPRKLELIPPGCETGEEGGPGMSEVLLTDAKC